jgi:hypothetical protein
MADDKKEKNLTEELDQNEDQDLSKENATKRLIKRESLQSKVLVKNYYQ